MTTLAEIRDTRADAEEQFIAVMDCIAVGRVEPELIAQALGYHREVCVCFKAELSLISHGTLKTEN